MKEGGSPELDDEKGLTQEHDNEEINRFSISKVPQEREARMYYADWGRSITVYMVVFIHCLMNAGDLCDLSQAEREKKEGIFKIVNQIGMPLFFYISGLSMTFFDFSKSGFKDFVKKKA